MATSKKQKQAKPAASRPGDNGPVARGTRLMVPVGLLRANPWNPNEQSPFIQAKMGRSLRRFGVIKELLVREVGPDKPAGAGNASVAGYEVIDGEHRLNEIRDSKLPEVEVRNLGVVSDAEAQELTIVLNEVGGAPNPRKLSNLIAVLDSVGLRGEFEDVAPYTEDEVRALLKIQELDPGEGFAAASLSKGKQEAPYLFQLGPHKGQLPAQLGRRLDALYEVLAARAKTSDAVVVAADMCAIMEEVNQ